MTSVGVVVCAYDLGRWARTVEAVASVLAQDAPVHEVIVVIDHNPELLQRAEEAWTDPRVRVVPSTGAQGLSGARNSGVSQVASEVVAFLDDDAVAEPSWIRLLLGVYAEPEVVACGGRVIPALGGPRPGWWPLEFDWVVGCSYVGLPEVRSEVRNVIGANMSVRRDVAVEAGGFAEGIGRVGLRPLGCEETDLLIRMAQHRPGARVVYEPNSAVHHWVPVERLTWAYFRARCVAEGLSKAQVAARVGPAQALATERAYVRRVLPVGIGRAVRAGQPRRAAAIVAGTALTAAGYARGRLAATGGRANRVVPRPVRSSA